MAVILREINDKDQIKVIASCDDAIEIEEIDPDSDEKSSYMKYLEDLDESKLKFVEGKQPTRFVLRLSLPAKYELRLEDEQVAYDRKGNPSFKISTRMFEQVRMSLVDIENPEDTEQPLIYKKHNEYGASTELVKMLKNAGIVDELFLALENAKKDVVAKKK